MKTKSLIATLSNSLLLALPLGLLLIPGTAFSTPISCGQTVSGTTTSPSENDSYTLSGSAGQKVSVSLWADLSDIGNSDSMVADIYDPSGNLLVSITSAYSGISGNSGAAVNTELPSSGTYTILVHSLNYIHTASYALSLQSVIGGGCNSQAITCGQTITTNTTVSSEMDAYNLSGSAGQKVSVSLWADLSDIGNSDSMVADIYDPSGNLLVSITSAYSGISGNSGAAVNTELPSSGTYTILVHSLNYIHTASYALSLQSVIGGGCNSQAITCGQTITTNTTVSSEMDAYNLSGSAGQKVSVSLWADLSDIGNSDSMVADIYDPSGNLLVSITSAYSGISGNSGAAVNTELPSSGTYTILVHSLNYIHTASYALSLQSVIGGGCNGVAIPCGQTINGQISLHSQMDAYELAASAGEHVILSDSGSAGLVVNIYDPTGSNVVNMGISTSTNYVLTDTGIYTVLVHSGSYNSVGSYNLTLTVLGGCAQEFVDLAVVTTNQGGCLPLELVDSSPVAWVSFTVQAPSGILSVATIDAGSQFTNATITPGTNSQWFVTMQANPANTVTGDQIIGQICFNSGSTQSVFVPIVLSSLVVTNQGGSIPGPILQGGTAVVIANQSLLKAGLTTNGQPMYTLYGKPNTPYKIEYATNLAANSLWFPLSTNTLPADSIYTSLIQGTLSNAQVLFIRGLQQ